MIRFLVNRPVAVMVSFLALLLLGIAAGRQIPTSLLPDADIPAIHVRIQAGDLSAREVEQRITRLVREALQQLGGLEHIESSSGTGIAEVDLNFEHGTDISLAYIAVNEKLDGVMDRLPRDVERPEVTRLSIVNIPVFHLYIYEARPDETPQRLAELSTLSREVIRRRLEQVAEIAMVDISGYTRPQVQLTPREDRLRMLGIPPDVLLRALSANRIDFGNIQVQDGHYRFFLRVASPMETLESLSAIPLNVGGRIFPLSELAAIHMDNAPVSGAFYANGHRAIDIAVVKQQAAKMEDLQSAFYQLVTDFKTDYPDLRFEVAQDQTALLDYAVSNLKQDLVLGGLLAFVLMLVFIRRTRAAVLVGITIPMSLLISQLGFFLFGISFNVISLGGLILGLGMIIDNSIVVIDTITLHRSAQPSLSEAAVAGTNEIIVPLISSVLTNCAVFVPLIFMSGLAGALFYDQALSVTIGVVASMLIAILLLPPLFLVIHRKMPSGRRQLRELPVYVDVTGMYERGIRWAFGHKLAVCGMVLAVVCGGLYCFSQLEKERLPPVSRHELEVAIDWNADVNWEDAQARIEELVAGLHPRPSAYAYWVGEQQYLLAGLRDIGHQEARVYLSARRADDIQPLKDRFTEVFEHRYPGALLDIRGGQNAFDAVFADREPPLRLLVSAAGKRALPPLPELNILLDSLRIMRGLTVPPVALSRQLILRTDIRRASVYGLNIGQINDALANAIKPRTVDQFQGAESLVPVVMGSRVYSSISSLLEQATVANSQGINYPLSAFVTAEPEETYRSISAGKQGQYYAIDLAVDDPGTYLPALRYLTDGMADRFSVVYAGSYYSNRALMRQMVWILLVSVLLLYFILAAQFESLVQPLFILAELPIAIMGALIVLYLAGNTFNLMAMIGMVIMGGLVINDSILKIDAINRMRRKGMPLMEAIHEGGVRRLRPMVMITLTSVGALLPTLFMDDLGSEIQKPLALALMGGMTIGLLVSLFFLPLVYWLVYRNAGREANLNKPHDENNQT